MTATRQKRRGLACGEWHVEDNVRGTEKRFTYPWAKDLKVEQI